MLEDKTNIILAIETSCDETSVAVVKDGRDILANLIASQISIHQQFGGVVPEVASRKHMEVISLLVEEALAEAGVQKEDLACMAVTNGPGLAGALLVGVSFAKAYAFALGKPLLGVNHIMGHIYANFIEHPSISLPAVCLVVSGGHTHLFYLKSHDDIQVIGRTRDDAAGEAFDKIARAMGLGYPGGPLIDKLAREGNNSAFNFPRSWLEKGSLDFSFSGIKSAVLNTMNNAGMKGEELVQADLAASFQEAVVEVLVTKAFQAVEQMQVKSLLIAGGVAANSALRRKLETVGQEKEIKVYYPSPLLCTDNGAMIGVAGYYRFISGERAGLDLNAVPNLKL
ncbi:MAG: tRNA (adenosine(37)-N6)-threonylcarbamoyltransferase complex transferase subunit TsaD [Clostridia bacterium]|nr:tRNA (adenosine(37)-N6)-threonylcarbamoyltransferase complex transferase subunit TsaD [Clostridia bacterium]